MKPLINSRISFLLIASIFILSCKQQKKKKVETQKPISQVEYLLNCPDSGVRIFLTFDDGPYQTTPQLTKLLSEQKLKSSFFIVGSQIEHSVAFDSIFKATKANKLFKIYNHTYSHAVTKGRIHKYYSKPEGVWDDINKNKSLIATEGNITRLPGKNTWKIRNYVRYPDKSTTKLIDFLNAERKNEAIVGWDVEWKIEHSLNRSDVDALIKEIAVIVSKDTSAKKEIVILSHDYLYRTNESLGNFTYFVERLKEKFNPSFHWVEELRLIN